MLFFLILLITMTGSVSDIALVDGVLPEHLKQPHAVYVGYIDNEFFVDMDDEFPCNDAGIFQALNHMERLDDDHWKYLYGIVPAKKTGIKTVDQKTLERMERWLKRINVSDELLIKE